MKNFLIILLTLPLLTFGQDVDRYFESIRNSRVELTAFFNQMPKGGDLHHHFSGSVYAETYINYIVQKDLYLNRRTYDIKETVQSDTDYVRISKLQNPYFSFYKQKLLEKWSVKDYNNVSQPSDKLFFSTFPSFDIAHKNTLDEGLLEIKERARIENVSYIETMFTRITCDVDVNLPDPFNIALRQQQKERDYKGTENTLEAIYGSLDKTVLEVCASKFNQELQERHDRLRIDDSTFLLRYQNYVLRLIDDPTQVFKDIIVAFESAAKSSLVVGVNIVGAEDDEVSMKDYWLHMQMFKFCHNKYPDVKYAMHAGELTLGIVKPEELSWHVNAAVFEAGASRIGHGVDLAYEKESPRLLSYMKEQKIPIEINLSSNEFILKVRNDEHPLILYKNAGVPIVIATDDAGVLRSNMTHQYVLLASRYSGLSYSEIKQIVLNSIRFSFIEEPAIRKSLLADLERRFKVFELSLPLGARRMQ
ncbi:MAG: adenosine deaminase [Chitinophagaceae bacterium]|nr:adenosine deaminase [Chitinophagaceae bacterium]